MTGYKTIATSQLLDLREGSQKLHIATRQELNALTQALQDPPEDVEVREQMARTRAGLMDLEKQMRSFCRQVDALVQKPPIRSSHALCVVGGRDADTSFDVDPRTGQLMEPG